MNVKMNMILTNKSLLVVFILGLVLLYIYTKVYRRETFFVASNNTNIPINKQETLDESDVIYLNKILNEKFDYFKENQKNYQIWHHRKVIVEKSQIFQKEKPIKQFIALLEFVFEVFQHPIEFIELGFILLHFFFVQKPIIVIGCFTFNFDNFWLAPCAFKQLVAANCDEVSSHRASQLKVGVTNTF